MSEEAEPFPFEQVLALLAAALRGDHEGARLLVDLLPASQLRDATYLLTRMLAGAMGGRPSAGESSTEAGRCTADWLSRVLSDIEAGSS